MFSFDPTSRIPNEAKRVTAQLRIIWEGTTPGLREKRLSLMAFGPALAALLKAARNIARHKLALARGEEYDPGKATKSTLVDVQLLAYEGGSADSTFEVVEVAGPDRTLSLFPNLAAEVVRALRSSIQREAAGQHVDRFVGEFLRELPPGLEEQRYQVIIDGHAEEALIIREMTLPTLEAPPSELVLLRGLVDALSFNAYSTSVRVMPFVGKSITVSATKEQVERAVELRHGPVQALCLMAEQPRLLWVKRDAGSDALPTPMSPDERMKLMFSRWNDTFRELAK